MFQLTFNEQNKFVVEFGHQDQLSAEFHSTVYVPAVEMYDGSYEAIPKVDEQLFRTANKMMVGDFAVKGIPYYETSNQKGITVYIADDIND